MRNHLDGGAEIVAASLLGEDVLIDAAGRDVVGLACGPSGETFVMAKVEVGLGAIVGHEHFAVLIRRHRSGSRLRYGSSLRSRTL